MNILAHTGIILKLHHQRLHVRFSINKCYVMKQTFLKIKKHFCTLFHNEFHQEFVHESKERSLIIYCLKQPNDRKDHHKTWLLWQHFHSQEKMLQLLGSCHFSYFCSKLPSRLNKPKDATDMTALTGISLGLSGQYLLHLVSKGDLQLQLFVKKCSWLNLPRDLEWLNKSQK